MTRAGRPRRDPVELRTVSVHFRLAVKDYDRTIKQAAADRLALADWLRRLVDQACRPRDTGWD